MEIPLKSFLRNKLDDILFTRYLKKDTIIIKPDMKSKQVMKRQILTTIFSWKNKKNISLLP
jgi:hypothetical protein